MAKPEQWQAGDTRRGSSGEIYLAVVLEVLFWSGLVLAALTQVKDLEALAYVVPIAICVAVMLWREWRRTH